MNRLWQAFQAHMARGHKFPVRGSGDVFVAAIAEQDEVLEAIEHDMPLEVALRHEFKIAEEN